MANYKNNGPWRLDNAFGLNCWHWYWIRLLENSSWYSTYGKSFSLLQQDPAMDHHMHLHHTVIIRALTFLRQFLVAHLLCIKRNKLSQVTRTPQDVGERGVKLCCPTAVLWNAYWWWREPENLEGKTKVM